MSICAMFKATGTPIRICAVDPEPEVDQGGPSGQVEDTAVSEAGSSTDPEPSYLHGYKRDSWGMSPPSPPILSSPIWVPPPTPPGGYVFTPTHEDISEFE